MDSWILSMFSCGKQINSLLRRIPFQSGATAIKSGFICYWFGILRRPIPVTKAYRSDLSALSVFKSEQSLAPPNAAELDVAILKQHHFVAERAAFLHQISKLCLLHFYLFFIISPLPHSTYKLALELLVGSRAWLCAAEVAGRRQRNKQSWSHSCSRCSCHARQEHWVQKLSGK